MSTFSFTCSACGKRLKGEPRLVGRRVQCPRCQTRLVVPHPESELPAEVVAPRQAVPPPVAAAPAPPGAGDPTVLETGEPLFRFRTSYQGDEELDLTPMVDVTFQLLIFFMLTAAFALQKTIPVPVPDRAAPVSQHRTLQDIEEDDDYVIVRVDGDDTIWVEEEEASKMELVARLRRLREAPQGAASRPPNSLLVMASGEAHHETVVLVLDAGTEVGMENVRLSTVDDDET